MFRNLWTRARGYFYSELQLLRSGPSRHMDVKKKYLKGADLDQAKEVAFKPFLAPLVEQAQLEAREKVDWK